MGSINKILISLVLVFSVLRPAILLLVEHSIVKSELHDVNDKEEIGDEENLKCIHEDKEFNAFFSQCIFSEKASPFKLSSGIIKILDPPPKFFV